MTAEEIFHANLPPARVVIYGQGQRCGRPAIGRRDIAGVVRNEPPRGIDHIQMEEMECGRRRPGYGKDKCAGLARAQTAWARNLGRRDRCGRRGEDGGFVRIQPNRQLRLFSDCSGGPHVIDKLLPRQRQDDGSRSFKELGRGGIRIT